MLDFGTYIISNENKFIYGPFNVIEVVYSVRFWRNDTDAFVHLYSFYSGIEKLQPKKMLMDK